MMPQRIRWAAIAMLMVFSTTGRWEARAEETAASDLLVQSDLAYDTGDLEKSTTLSRSVLIQDPQSYGAAWRLSRALIGHANLDEDPQRRHALLQEARRAADLATQLQPNGVEGFTCLAICAGSLSGLAGRKESIELAEEARAAAERSVAIDERNHLGHLVLGIWNREVATVGGLKKIVAKIFYGGIPAGASLEQSESHLRRAVELAPERLNHHRELGRTLMKMKRYGEAAESFATAVSLEPRYPADEIYLEDARERLAEARDHID